MHSLKSSPPPNSPTRKKNTTGGPHAGVYAVIHPNGVEIGEAKNVFERNSEYTRFGIRWTVARSMPGSTGVERRKAEREIADVVCSLGYTVVTQNTSAHLEWFWKAGQYSRRGHPLTPEHREKIAALNRAKVHSAQWREKMSHAARNRSPSTRKKLSEAMKRVWQERKSR